SVRMRATLSNENSLLRPGMFATIQTAQPRDNEGVTLPRTAISYQTYGNFVFVVAANDNGGQVVNRRSVMTGEVRDGRASITSGLEAGETVVATGLLRLRAGQRVDIQDESGQEASE